MFQIALKLLENNTWTHCLIKTTNKYEGEKYIPTLVIKSVFKIIPLSNIHIHGVFVASLR